MRTDDWTLLILLGLMAMSLRLIGLFGGKYVSSNATAQAMLQALPGSLLVALVVPDLISRGIAGWIAMVEGFCPCAMCTLTGRSSAAVLSENRAAASCARTTGSTGGTSFFATSVFATSVFATSGVGCWATFSSALA